MYRSVIGHVRALSTVRKPVSRERAAMAGGVDPRASRRTVRVLLPEWLRGREHSVSRKTYVADASLIRLTPPALVALRIGMVTDRQVARALVALNGSGLAESSIRRFRASLSAFFAWAVRERLTAVNPGECEGCPRRASGMTAQEPRSSCGVPAGGTGFSVWWS
jgi:site-specific recombinase XerC